MNRSYVLGSCRCCYDFCCCDFFVFLSRIDARAGLREPPRSHQQQQQSQQNPPTASLESNPVSRQNTTATTLAMVAEMTEMWTTMQDHPRRRRQMLIPSDINSNSNSNSNPLPSSSSSSKPSNSNDYSLQSLDRDGDNGSSSGNVNGGSARSSRGGGRSRSRNNNNPTTLPRTVTPIERAAAAAVAGAVSFSNSFDSMFIEDLDRRDEDGLARVMAQLRGLSEGEGWLM